MKKQGFLIMRTNGDVVLMGGGSLGKYEKGATNDHNG